MTWKLWHLLGLIKVISQWSAVYMRLFLLTSVSCYFNQVYSTIPKWVGGLSILSVVGLLCQLDISIEETDSSFFPYRDLSHLNVFVMSVCCCTGGVRCSSNLNTIDLVDLWMWVVNEPSSPYLCICVFVWLVHFRGERRSTVQYLISMYM